MTKMPLLFVLLASYAASAEPHALHEAGMLADGAPARAIVDGARAPEAVVAEVRPATAQTANLTIAGGAPAAKPQAAPPAPASGEPGFFSKTWDAVKKPSIFVPAGMALAMGAMGFMIAGPLGALTGAAIGGLLGFIFAKTLG